MNDQPQFCIPIIDHPLQNAPDYDPASSAVVGNQAQFVGRNLATSASEQEGCLQRDTLVLDDPSSESIIRNTGSGVFDLPVIPQSNIKGAGHYSQIMLSNGIHHPPFHQRQNLHFACDDDQEAEQVLSFQYLGHEGEGNPQRLSESEIDLMMLNPKQLAEVVQEAKAQAEAKASKAAEAAYNKALEDLRTGGEAGLYCDDHVPSDPDNEESAVSCQTARAPHHHETPGNQQGRTLYCNGQVPPPQLMVEQPTDPLYAQFYKSFVKARIPPIVGSQAKRRTPRQSHSFASAKLNTLQQTHQALTQFAADAGAAAAPAMFPTASAVAAGPTIAAVSSTEDETDEEWDAMFASLRFFKKKNGHCNVPKFFPANSELAEWAQVKRQMCLTTPLAKERYHHLLSIGFFSANDPRSKELCDEKKQQDKTSSTRKDPNMFDTRWEHMFQRLIKFKEKHGHCDVPLKNPDDKKLGIWVKNQRYQRTSLRKDRKDRLRSIGFEWGAQISCQSNREWMQQFKKLIKYKNVYGDFNVPLNYRDCKLVQWIENLHSEIEANQLSEERMGKLRSIQYYVT